MLNLPLYSNQKLLLSFEFGLTIAEVAKKQKIKLTPEIIERAEKILLNEFRKESAEKIAIGMIPTILAVFETE